LVVSNQNPESIPSVHSQDLEKKRKEEKGENGFKGRNRK
jgi:hypothetical protein